MRALRVTLLKVEAMVASSGKLPAASRSIIAASPHGDDVCCRPVHNPYYYLSTHNWIIRSAAQHVCADSYGRASRLGAATVSTNGCASHICEDTIAPCGWVMSGQWQRTGISDPPPAPSFAEQLGSKDVESSRDAQPRIRRSDRGEVSPTSARSFSAASARNSCAACRNERIGAFD